MENPRAISAIADITKSISDVARDDAKKKLPGGELYYLQSCSFTAYLIDQHSLDYALDCIRLNIPFEDAFGMTIEDSIEAWKVYLLSM